MADIILKSLNEISKHKSYGGNSLEVNFANVQKSIEKVQYTERIWDRSRSQWMLKFLACSNADGWLRLRQISAEMYKKRTTLQDAKFKYAKGLINARIKREEMLEEENENKRVLLEIEAVEIETNSAETLVKVEGCMKEIETLGQMHDELKERLGGDITEEEFEKAQTKAHIKRSVMQAVRDVKQDGRIKIGNAEYIEQCGISTSSMQKEILAFIEQESKSCIGDTSLLHKFLDAIAEKYHGAVIQQAEWLGFDPKEKIDFTYQP